MLTAWAVTVRGQDPQAFLVAEIERFLKTWERLLNEHAALEPGIARGAEREVEELRSQSADAGVGGLAHHFAQFLEHLQSSRVDPSQLRQSLRAISEITWQLKQELRVAPRSPPGPPPFEHAPRVALDQSLAAPPLLSLSAAPSLALKVPRFDEPAFPPNLSRPNLVAVGLRSPTAPPTPGPEPATGANVPIFPRTSVPPLLQGGPPDGNGRSKPRAQPEARAEPPRISSPSALGEARLGAHAKERPPHVDEPRGAAALHSTFFGFRAFNKGRAGARHEAARGSNLFGFRKGVPADGPLAPPKLLVGHGGLPLLPGTRNRPEDVESVGADLDARLRPLHSKSGTPARRSAQPSAKRESPSTGRTRGPAPHASRGAPWFAISIALPVFIVLAGGVFLFLDGRARSGRSARAAAVVQAPSSAAPVAAPVAAPETQQLNDLMTKIHGFGGKESPELSALLNADASATYQALAQPCEGNSPNCESQHVARDLLIPRKIARHESGGNNRPVPRWLAGLKIPAIGAHDHPDVQRWLEYYSSHPVGRELFQTMLFRCGAHQDLINKTLVHYGLPQDLLAVVLTESACVPNAESGVGARGLWQLMAPTARAYHLYVQEGVIDERVSPVKSTEAAVRFLGDLYHKMGNWEIALASYNAGSGPFRILARLRQAGEDASFWDLVEAGLVPQETASYVPRIQAYAIILANLRHFDFSTAQMRTAEETADLEVPSGARLGQVARAAGTSVSYLRALNPDLIGTVVPNLPSKRLVLQVPKAAAFRARDSLDQFLQEQLDLCVSSAFDWGREQFTAEKQAKCAAHKER